MSNPWDNDKPVTPTVSAAPWEMDAAAPADAAAPVAPVAQQPEPNLGIGQPAAPITTGSADFDVNDPAFSGKDGQGRFTTALSQMARGATGVFASIPKSIAIRRAENVGGILDMYEAIDRGEDIDRSKQAKLGMGSVNVDIYRNSPPAQRKELRDSLMEEVADPRESKLYKAGESIDDYVKENLSVNPKFAEEFWSGKIPNALGSMLGFMGATLVLRRSLVKAGMSEGAAGAAGASLTGMEVSKVQGFEDALDHKSSLEDAFRSSRLNEVAGLTEGIPITRLLDRIDSGTGGFFKRTIKDMLKAGTEEAIQESFQSIYGNLVASYMVKYDPDRGMFTGTVEGATVGFTTGALVQFLGNMIAGRRGGKITSETHQDQEEQGPAPKEQGPVPAEDVFGKDFADEAVGEKVAGEMFSEQDVAPDTTTIDPDLIAEGNAYLAEGQPQYEGGIDWQPPETDEVVTPLDAELAPVGVDLIDTEGTIEYTREVDTPDLGIEDARDASRRVASDKRVSELDKQLGDVVQPEGLKDPRIKRLEHRDKLELMANDLVKGGGVVLIPDPNFVPGESDKPGEVPMIRTPSLNPEWFKAMSADREIAMTTEDVVATVEKALAGKKLGVRQSRVITAMLDNITNDRTSPAMLDEARNSLFEARNNLPPISTYTDADAGQLYEEDSYPPSMTEDGRLMYELANEAILVDEARAEQILESKASDLDVAKQLYEVIHSAEKPTGLQSNEQRGPGKDVVEVKQPKAEETPARVKDKARPEVKPETVKQEAKPKSQPAFEPTHKTIDGTPVRAYEDETGVWEDFEGNIIEDNNAEPIKTTAIRDDKKRADTDGLAKPTSSRKEQTSTSVAEKPTDAKLPDDEVFADNYARFEGVEFSQKITIEGGETVTLTMDSAEALRQADERVNAAKNLVTCLKGG